MTGEEIRKLIVGNTLQGPVGAQMYDWYYKRDGTMTGVIGADDDGDGTWLIKESNVFCQTWTQYFDGEQLCYEFYRLQESGKYLLKNVDADRSSDIEVWKLLIGNPFHM